MTKVSRKKGGTTIRKMGKLADLFRAQERVAKKDPVKSLMKRETTLEKIEEMTAQDYLDVKAAIRQEEDVDIAFMEAIKEQYKDVSLEVALEDVRDMFEDGIRFVDEMKKKAREALSDEKQIIIAKITEEVATLLGENVPRADVKKAMLDKFSPEYITEEDAELIIARASI